MNLGEKIRQLRIENNMTQSDLASKLHTTKQTIFKYESGLITNLPLNRISELAEALNVPAAYLAGWETDLPEDTASITDELDPVTQELFDLVDGMSSEDLLMVIDMIKAIKKRRGDGE